MGFIVRFIFAYVRLLMMTAALMTAAIVTGGPGTAKPEADVGVSGNRRDPGLEPDLGPPDVRGQHVVSAGEVPRPARETTEKWPRETSYNDRYAIQRNDQT